MKIQCKNCLGSGLIGGNKEKPWLLEGHRSVCGVCSGTGMVEEVAGGSVAEQEPVKAPEVPDTSKSDEQTNIEADMDIDEEPVV